MSIHEPIATFQMAQLKRPPTTRLGNATPHMKGKTESLQREQLTVLNGRLNLGLTPRRPRISSCNGRMTVRTRRRSSKCPLILRREHSGRKHGRSHGYRKGGPFTGIGANIRMVASMGTPERPFNLKRIVSITLLRYLMFNIFLLT